MGRTMIWIGGPFAALGLVFVALGGWSYQQARSFAEQGQRAQGTVIEMIASRDNDDDGGYTYAPMVEFRDAAGELHRFTSRVGSNPPSYSTGEAVEVIYTPQAPDEAVIDSFADRFLMPSIFGGLGALFTAIGLGLLLAWVRGRRIAAELRARGLPLQAKITDCYRDTSVTVNGRSPWRVVCQATHPATGAMQSFKSEAIWVDPDSRLSGRDLRVFVDPARPKRHLIDLSPYFSKDELG
ncbi:MAG TPA: DUF3592 domain-containing protein [Croceibacterium sp.]